MSRKNEYMRVYVNKRYHDRRRKALSLLGDACVVCGATKNLHIDHINPETKTMNLSRTIHGAPWKKIENELKKCQLLCESCHKAKTLVDGSRFKNVALGEKINHAKLTKENVLEIRQKYECENYTHEELSKLYGVSRSAITQIINRVTWKHI